MALTKITGQVINTATDVTVGVLTVTDTLAVGGTVSVGGTLTYEDVTNIDSVGLVTARNGIVVGSGITLSKDGDIFATGVTTSTTFVGNLTGNVTGNISGGTVAGSTGTFTGDVDIASSLVHTGDTDTKLSFSTNTIKFDTNTEERVRITTDGELLVNTTTVSPHVRLNQKLGVVQVGNYGGASLTNYGGTTAVNKAILDFNRSRGTSNASMTSVASGDGLAHIVFRGADGTNFIDSAAIRADVDGTPGTNDMPGRLVFETTADGSNSLSERMRITEAGRVGIGENSPDALLHLATGASTTCEIRLTSNNTGSGSGDRGRINVFSSLNNGTEYQCGYVDIDRSSGTDDIAHLLVALNDGTSVAERVRITADGHILPAANDGQDLGSSSKRWRDIYTGDLNLSNKGNSNDVDGSWGDYTIQEGESDLFLINNRSGKKFKFNLTEVL